MNNILMINVLKRVRERVNLFLYDSQHQVLRVFNYLTFFVSLSTLALIIYYYGFPVTEETREIIINVIKGLFIVFILNYMARLFYAFGIKDFLRRHWIEGILISLLVIDIISVYVFNFRLLEIASEAAGIRNFNAFYIVFLQLYIMILVGIELVHVSQNLLQFKLKPAVLFLFSYIAIIIFGAILLLLPEMTAKQGSMPLIDALFTSVSATCVTGLIVVDTATYFTTKGHVVIMILMQLGGIGIVTFASFFALFLKRGFGIKHQTALQDFFSEESVFNARQLLGQVILYTIVIELIGSFMIFSMWGEYQYNSLGEKLFYTVFHAVSAFCNAGFSLFSNGLMEDLVRTNYVMHVVFALLIIFGSIGFPVLKDLFSVSRLRERFKLRWKEWKTSTTIAVYSSIFLIVLGAVVFWVLETDRTISDQSPVEGIITSFFQSVTRTAGFSTVSMAELAAPTLIMLMFLMFVGGSSGSTAGGIKTSTFVVVLTSVYATIRGKKNLEIARRTISTDLLQKAFSIVVFTLIFIFIAFFSLSLLEPQMDTMAILFEAVSGVCTVGLSMGITGELSAASKTVLILAMYVGRVGSLTLAFALSSPVSTTNYKYPNTHIMVG